MTANFYDAQEEQSAIKTAIVVKYFRPWATIILSNKVDKVGYLDLYCGPGKFKDGTESTPLLVLRQIMESERLKASVVTIFNDHTPEFIEDLKAAVSAIPGIDELAFEPEFSTDDVGESYEEFFESTKTIPLLCFLDPWG